MAVEYRVLGPLEVLVDGTLVAVPAGQSRVLLATLLLRPNQFVSADELVDRLWDGAPPSPSRARNTLQMVVNRLRMALGEASCVQTLAGGYRAEVDAASLDLLRFRALVADGDFTAAVGLWRGSMLRDVVSDALHREDVAPVTEEWLLALERRIAADLERGRAADLVAELRTLTAQHQFREAFWGQLMLALAHSGQQAQALAAYQEIRRLLADELGVDPGVELQEVHRRVLSGAGEVRGSVPRQLPSSTPRFVGRTEELRVLTGLIGQDELVIATITGTAGVGKTTLAVEWARGVADRFPDGQLYVNLRGFDVHRDPVAPGEVLSRFLDGLGVAAERIPADLEARASMFRSLVAGRRMLVLLDNARDTEQVRRLLPGHAPSFVLVTSRNRLTGLAVTDGARPLSLDVLSRDEARALLVGRLGADRITAAADDLISWCGALPLALAIVAARAVQEPKLPLDALVTELADERTRLDSLDTDEEITSVRTVFHWSYRQLSADTARLFRLIGVHPGPDITSWAAASLSGWSADQVRESLHEMVSANLLVEHVAGRFTCHDLLRVYAADRAAAEEPAESRAEALERMFTHYVHTLAAIDLEHLAGYRNLEPLPAPPPGVSAEKCVDLQEADDWLHAEYNTLRAVIGQAGEQGFDRHTLQLVWYAFDLIDRVAPWRDWLWALDSAEEAATRLGDHLYLARLLHAHAVAFSRLGLLEESKDCFARSSREHARIGNVPGQVRSDDGVAWVLGMLGRPREALEVAQKALDLMRTWPTMTNRQLGMALHQVAWALTKAGEHEEAIKHYAEWEAVCGDTATFAWQAQAALAKGEAWVQLGEHTQAAAELRRALDLFIREGTWHDIAHTRNWLGSAHEGLGEHAEARRQWTEALRDFEHHQHPDADEVRTKLAALTSAKT